MSGWNEYVKMAKDLLCQHQALLSLIAEAILKAGSCRDALRKCWDNLMALIRLVKAWALGEYKQIPWLSIAFAVAAIIYFVNPFDLIPDTIPVIGYLDDATVIGFAISAMGEDFNAFINWEQGI